MDFQRNKGPGFSDFEKQIESSKTLDELISFLDSIQKNRIQIPSGMNQTQKQTATNEIWKKVEHFSNGSAQKPEIEESAKMVCAKITGCP